MGDYGNARIIARNISSGITTGLYNTQGNVSIDGEVLNMNATEGLIVNAILTWSTRIFFAQVISTQVDGLVDFNSR